MQLGMQLMGIIPRRVRLKLRMSFWEGQLSRGKRRFEEDWIVALLDCQLASPSVPVQPVRLSKFTLTNGIPFVFVERRLNRDNVARNSMHQHKQFQHRHFEYQYDNT